MATTQTQARQLEQTFVARYDGLDEAALGDVCAGILDIPDAYRAIFEKLLPGLERVDPSAREELFCELVSLRIHLEHMRHHAESAVDGVQRLMDVLSAKAPK